MRSFTWGVDTIHSVKFNPIEVKTKIANPIWWLSSWIEEDVCQNSLNLFSDSMIGFSRLCWVFVCSGPVKSRVRGTQRQFSVNICSEDDLRSRIFGTFVVKFLACVPLLGFSNI